MMTFRGHLIGLGATILAPCPHDRPCPMRDDWCHFAVRLPRSAAHRAAKGAKRGFEDEKFTYVVAVRAEDPDRGVPRVLRHPLVRPGHIRFRLCAQDGLQEVTVARSDPGYRTARKLSWGDRFEE
jgi:ribosomal protein RSM22 (predicted rRNA methylase)